MKIFKNISQRGNPYYVTNYYSKDLGGNILSKKIFVRFQRGTAPKFDKTSYDFTLKANIEGEEYDVLLDAYDNNGVIEGRLYFIKSEDNNQQIVKSEDTKDDEGEYQAQSMNEYLGKTENDNGPLDLNTADIPWY